MSLDLTSLTCKPKSRERSSRPTKHVTFALSQRKSASPARVQTVDDDGDDRPLVGSDHTTASEEDDGDDKPLVQPTFVLKRESSAKTECSYTVTKKKRTSSLARSVRHTGTRCVRNLA